MYISQHLYNPLIYQSSSIQTGEETLGLKEKSNPPQRGAVISACEDATNRHGFSFPQLAGTPQRPAPEVL